MPEPGPAPRAPLEGVAPAATLRPVRRVLGIDPGLAVTGYGVVDEQGSGGTLIASGVVRTQPKLARAERLGRIFDAVRALIVKYAPHEVAVEQQFVAENVRSAMAIGEARAAAMVAAAASALPVYEFAPTEIKESVTGWGGAQKDQVHRMVLVHLGIAEVAGPADVTDAIAAALTRLAAARLEVAIARSRP